MLDFIALSAIAWFNIFKETDNNLQPLELFAWEQSAIFNLPSSSQDLVTETLVKVYLQNLASQEFNPERQGVWVQSGWTTPVSNQ